MWVVAGGRGMEETSRKEDAGLIPSRSCRAEDARTYENLAHHSQRSSISAMFTSLSQVPQRSMSTPDFMKAHGLTAPPRNVSSASLDERLSSRRGDVEEEALLQVSALNAAGFVSALSALRSHHRTPFVTLTARTCPSPLHAGCSPRHRGRVPRAQLWILFIGLRGKVGL